jgi:hypothetical protein
MGELGDQNAEGPSTNPVLSDGVGIHLLESGTFVDLAPYTEDPAGIDDLRRSDQYVLGGTVSVDVSPVPGQG